MGKFTKNIFILKANKINPLRIILDGPDKNGKTEIAKELSHVTNAPYFKNSNEFGAFLNMDSEYFVNTVIYAEPFFLDFINQSNGSFIMKVD